MTAPNRVPPIAVLPASTLAIEIVPIAEPVEVVLLQAARGPAGRDGNAASVFNFVQASPSSLWTVNHNLGRKPAAVSVLSPGGIAVFVTVLHVSDNQLQISFAAPASGSAMVQ